MKPPMPYSGGKQTIAQAIAETFPTHVHYIEPYAGALSVLLAKPTSKIETVNDLNGDLITFWRVLREQPADLERVCALTPHSRAELTQARDLTDIPDLERARRVWVQLTQSRGAGMGDTSGWRFTHGTNRMALARYLDGYLARIAPCAHRLRGVAIENRPALDLIATYDRPGVLWYVDPPYLMSARYGDQYVHEMGTETEHAELLQALLGCSGAVAVSGYDSDLYRDLLGGWHRHEFRSTAMSGNARTEVMWTNYEPQPALFGIGGAS